ncbi:hypothetical protein LCGC14_2814240, partial [marine sediment metagenome]
DETQTHLMVAARSLRLEIRERRIAVIKAHKEQKADVIMEGRALDGIKNVLLGIMVPLEKYLGEQEDYAKIREEARETDRRAKAERLLAEQEEDEAESARLKVEAEEREKNAAAVRVVEEAAKTARIKASAEAEAEQKRHEAELAAAEERALAERALWKEREEEHEKELARARQVKCPQCGTQFDSADNKYVNEALSIEDVLF